MFYSLYMSISYISFIKFTASSSIGHPFSFSHFIFSKFPFYTASSNVQSFQIHPFPLNHFIFSIFPFKAAPECPFAP